MVAIDIDRGKGSQDRGSEEFLEKVLAVSFSVGMLDLFDRFGFDFAHSDFTDYEQRFIALSQFTATLLEAAKRCGIA